MKAVRLVFPVLAILLVFLTISPSLVITQAAAPRFVPDSIAFLTSYVLQTNRVIVNNNRLYSGWTGFSIADISDPARMRILDRIEGHYLYDFVLDGQYVYTAQQDLGVENLDILVDTISEFSAVRTKTNPAGVTLDSGHLFIANGSSGVLVADATKPADLTEIGRITLPGYANSATGSGNTVFVSTGKGGLHIFDISTPSAPVELAAYPTPGSAGVAVVDQNLLYLPAGAAGLRILDVTDPKTPKEIGFYDTLGLATRVVLQKPYAYVTDGENGLVILDVSDPKAPRLMAQHNSPGSATDVAVNGDLIFLADAPYGVRVLKWVPPATATVPSAGAAFDSTYDGVKYTFENGTFAADTRVIHQPVYFNTVPDGGEFLPKIGPFFFLDLLDAQGQVVTPQQVVKVSVPYSDAKIPPGTEYALGLYSWNGVQWARVPGTVVDEQNNVITAALNQATTYGVFIDKYKLPKK